jgi:hypothetical protein
LITKPVSYDKIKQNYKLEFVNMTKTSQYGGLPTFTRFLSQANLNERLVELLGKSAAKAMLQIMLGSLMGARTMEDVALFSKDKVIKDFIVRPLSATGIVRTLKNLSKSQIQSIHEFSLSNALLDTASGTDKDYFQTFDFDATAVEKYGKQEGVDYGYLEQDKIKKCYQYLIVRSEALNTILYGTIRDGSAHSQNDFCGYLNMILPLFNRQWSIRIRADSGYFNEAAFDLCHEYNVDFFVKAPMSRARKAQAMSPSLFWTEDLTNPDISYATRSTVTANKTIWNEIFKRIKDTTSPEGYTFHCLATNDLIAKPQAAYSFYNQRANIENINSELKGDLGLGHIVTKWFDVNDVITQSIIIVYQMLSHFKRTCLDMADKDKRVETLRDQLFEVPAEIMKSARRTWLRVYNTFFDGLTYARIFARIEALKNVFVLAYRLRSG